MNECLTCKHWQRDIYDGMIGICATLSEWRFQHEEENIFCTYEFGEDRKPVKGLLPLQASRGETRTTSLTVRREANAILEGKTSGA